MRIPISLSGAKPRTSFLGFPGSQALITTRFSNKRNELLGDRLDHAQRFLKSARVGDDVEEFGQHLRGQSQRDAGLENLPLQQLVGRLVRGSFDELELNQEGGVSSDHGLDSIISPKLSSSGEGNGRRKAPTD